MARSIIWIMWLTWQAWVRAMKMTPSATSFFIDRADRNDPVLVAQGNSSFVHSRTHLLHRLLHFFGADVRREREADGQHVGEAVPAYSRSEVVSRITPSETASATRPMTAPAMTSSGQCAPF